MYKSYIHTIIFHEKKAIKTSKHPHKIHIPQKYGIKTNILKLSSNKKWVVLLL
jgi:hypothetical protein